MDIEFLLTVLFFFHHWKDVILLFTGFHCCWQYLLSFLLYLWNIIYLFSKAFMFLFSFNLSSLTLKSLVMDFFQFSSVHLLSRFRLFATPWITARQASLSITNSRSSLKLMSIELVMPSRHLILCCPFSSCPQSLPVSRSFPIVNSSHEVAKVLEFQLQHQSFQWTLRTDLL